MGATRLFGLKRTLMTNQQDTRWAPFYCLDSLSKQNISRTVGGKCHVYLPCSCTYDHCWRQNARLSGPLA